MSFRSRNRSKFVACLVLLPSLIGIVISEDHPNQTAKDPYHNSVLLSSIQLRELNMVRITNRPAEMQPAVIYGCRLPEDELEVFNGVTMPKIRTKKAHAKKEDSPHRNKQKDAWLDVFVSKNAVQTIVSGEGEYPTGSIILKAKYNHPNRGEVELMTGMLKRERGYNPVCGDWEFFTASGDGMTITARGRIDSCMMCHKDYDKTDYVTRDYKIHTRLNPTLKEIPFITTDETGEFLSPDRVFK